jgi:transposase
VFMRTGIVVNVTGSDRRQLEAIISDRSAPQMHVWRAIIVLATDDGCGTAEIKRRSGKSKPVVWRWQARLNGQGRRRADARQNAQAWQNAASCRHGAECCWPRPGTAPGEATHWTGRMLAKAAGVSLGSVRRILEAHQLAPHVQRVLAAIKRGKQTLESIH